ncbi:MAG TPA: cytochrome c oxidase assembly protein [Flavisolibacter sp.]|jgi:putative membrane protein|nr:cytochrome c oxidase assembly protein [Flavisolibacter sp.]
MKMYLLQCSYVLQPHSKEHHHGSFVFLLLISIIFALYVVAAFSLNLAGKKWGNWKTCSFISGCILVAIALSPTMLDYAHHDFRGHMIQHLLLGMLAPVALVLGAPVTLAIRTVPHQASKALSSLLNSTFFHFLSHPVTAFLLNIGGMYALYLTPLYNNLHNSAALHYAVHFHFLAAGYLFTWSIIGPDPAPRRPKLFTRLLVLFLSVAAHAFLSKFMYAYAYPKNSLHSEAEIKEAAKIMYYGGDIIELLIIIAVFTIWYNKKGKPYYSFHKEKKYRAGSCLGVQQHSSAAKG